MRSAALLLLSLAACASAPHVTPRIGSAQVSPDFDSYRLVRVGLVPFSGELAGPEQARALQASFSAELSRSTPFELVLLDQRDLEEIRASEPYRRGWYRPSTIIGIARRYSLDAILFGTVLQQRCFPPQMLGLQVDMVAAETGMVIWTASVHLSADDPDVVQGLQDFYGRVPSEQGEQEEWELALLSPQRFARFAAWQVASLL